jgi:hypothetical protein
MGGVVGSHHGLERDDPVMSWHKGIFCQGGQATNVCKMIHYQLENSNSSSNVNSHGLK